MNEYIKIAIAAFILILMFACFKKQGRYWREMQTSRPTGALKAGYTVAILTVGLSLPLALYSNTPAGWELFISVLLMTVVFCAKITFSPAVIAGILGMCTYQLFVHDRFPFFEVWGAAASVLAWKLPEEVRALYATVTFIWALLVLVSGGASEVEASSTSDLADVTGLLPE
jgi:hypothetical protein